MHKRIGVGGTMITDVDLLGNVFRSVPGETTTPVWGFDDPSQANPKGRTLLFTCPKSAIPAEVFDLLLLWNDCRLVGMPPVAGGWLDQPEGVKRSFPIFSAEYQALQRRQGAGGAEQTAMMVAGTMMQALFGKR